MNIKEMKFPKDFVSGVRVNSLKYDVAKEQGYTVQKIIDDWFEENVTMDINPETHEIVFKLK